MRDVAIVSFAQLRGDPEEGLRVLVRTTPSPEYANRFADVQRTLNEQIDALDAQSPDIFVPADFEFVYKKNTTLVVPITVTDDFRVERVAVHVRRSA